MPVAQLYALITSDLPAGVAGALREQVAVLERGERAVTGRPADVARAAIGWDERAIDAERLIVALLSLAQDDLPRRWNSPAARAFGRLLTQAAEEILAIVRLIRPPTAAVIRVMPRASNEILPLVRPASGAVVRGAPADTIVDVLDAIKTALERGQTTVSTTLVGYERWLRNLVPLVRRSPRAQYGGAIGIGAAFVNRVQNAEMAVRSQLAVNGLRLEQLAAKAGTAPFDGAISTLWGLFSPDRAAEALVQDLGLRGQFPLDSGGVRSAMDRLDPLLARIDLAIRDGVIPDAADLSIVHQIQRRILGDPGTAMSRLESFIEHGEMVDNGYSFADKAAMKSVLQRLESMVVVPPEYEPR